MHILSNLSGGQIVAIIVVIGAVLLLIKGMKTPPRGSAQDYQNNQGNGMFGNRGNQGGGQVNQMGGNQMQQPMNNQMGGQQNQYNQSGNMGNQAGGQQGQYNQNNGNYR